MEINNLKYIHELWHDHTDDSYICDYCGESFIVGSDKKAIVKCLECSALYKQLPQYKIPATKKTLRTRQA